jgi:SAM-dependent methyltransferase
MAEHLNEIWKSWSNLSETVRQGRNPEQTPVTERGDESCRAFIGAMHVVGRELAQEIASEYDMSPFSRLLDVGGASGTYTAAFLHRNPGLRGVIFDLPKVVPFAEERMASAGLLDRVEIVGGDFYRDPLPGGCDVALLSAIIHQNSPEENVDLFRKVREALEPGGTLLIRDHIMSEDRLRPPAGALFALNMLVNTSGGDTYTLSEVRDQLHQAGYEEVRLVRSGESMDCLIQARKGA